MRELGATGLPTPRREDWRYTDLQTLVDAELDFAPRGPDRKALDAAARALAEHGVPADVPRLVFVDGHSLRSSARWTPLPASRSVTSTPIGSEPTATRGTPASHRGSPARGAQHGIRAVRRLASRVADGARIAGEIRLVLVASGAPKSSLSRGSCVEIGRGADVTIVQHIVDAAETDGWLNVVTEIALGRRSRLAPLSARRARPRAMRTPRCSRSTSPRALSPRSGSSTSAAGSCATTSTCSSREPGAALDLYGLLLAGEGQHVDDHTRIDHSRPTRAATRAFRGVIGKRGRGVFNGKVIVHRGAQGIDARQTSDNLLLSDQAEIDTKPELEIYADDVKCSHGSTVGELDAEHFSTCARAASTKTHARELLTTAFAATVIERIAAPAHARSVSPTRSARGCARSRRCSR